MVSLTPDSVNIHRLVQTTLRNQPPIGDSAPTGRLEAERLLSAAVAPWENHPTLAGPHLGSAASTPRGARGHHS